MEKSISGKSFESCISLEEYPWVRDAMPVLWGIGNINWEHLMCRGVDEATTRIHYGCVKLQTFISTKNERVIYATPLDGASEESIQRVIKSIDNYIADLDVPKSCEVDPATGKYPVNISSDYDAGWF